MIIYGRYYKLLNIPKNNTYFPKDDIRSVDPNLYYKGKDGKEYYTTGDLERADKEYRDRQTISDYPRSERRGR